MGVLALVVLAISLAGHAAGSQALPTFFGLLLALSLTLALSSVATSRRRSFGWILGFVLALQVLLHFTLVIVGSDHSGTAHESLIPGASGVLGHVVASILAAVVLAYGDRLLDRWASLLGTAFGSGFVLDAPVLAASMKVRTAHAAQHSAVVVDFAPRRGPPVFSN
jgi:hypothetical protein